MPDPASELIPMWLLARLVAKIGILRAHTQRVVGQRFREAGCVRYRSLNRLLRVVFPRPSVRIISSCTGRGDLGRVAALTVGQVRVGGAYGARCLPTAPLGPGQSLFGFDCRLVSVLCVRSALAACLEGAAHAPNAHFRDLLRSQSYEMLLAGCIG